MTLRSILVALPLCSLLVTAAHAATPMMPTAVVAVDANAALAEIDRRAAAFTDQSYDATMEIYKGGALKKTLEFHMVMKGLNKQFINFVAPGDVAGMKILMEDPETLYMYLPEFQKVRRIAAHVQNQGFLGSEFSPEDMSRVKLSPYYDAEMVGKVGTETTLKLTPKAGVSASWSRIDLVVDGSKGGVTKMHYYDGAGNHVRSQLREEWIKVGGELMPTKISMMNLKAGDTTVITLSNVVVNQGVADDVFSRRMLMR